MRKLVLYFIGGSPGGYRRFVLGAVLAAFVFTVIFFYPAISVSGEDVLESSPTLKYEIAQRLQELSREISTLDKAALDARVQERTLKREIAALGNSIEKLQLEIERTALGIIALEQEMAAIEASIADLKEKEQYERGVLSELLRAVDQGDDAEFIELFLTASTLSSFWGELHALDNMQERIQGKIADIRNIRVEQDTALEELGERRAEELALKTLEETQEAELEHEQVVKASLLGNARYQQITIEAVIIRNQQTAQKLQRQLFLLEGIGEALPFEEAVAKAKFVAEKTGVRPAFLLAVLQKESQWGAKVGTGNWRSDMHSRDHAAFLAICGELGFDPDTTPVSRKPSYGWGGAMGPAQFLPTTWLAWKDRISEITGHSPPSPWNIDDAFAGAALKLAAAGADARTPQVEHKAAMIYFAGGNWGKAAFQFYGNAVMELVELLEEEIVRLEK